MALKPWYKVVTPREDLREGKPLDASEFAVHLDKVRDGSAHKDYQDPKIFFEKTFLTKNLIELSSEVVRRLSGEKTETSAVYHMITQFGGGKTHALTLLYHLANTGPSADKFVGVNKILEKARVKSVPHSRVAVFVGTEFDTLTGRGGNDGTPLRKTPWGEIAYQLGGKESFDVVAKHDKDMIAPAGDVIKQILPKNKSCLILMDELINYISRNRKSGMGTQLYNFIHNLSEQARSLDNVVLAVSIPSMLIEMTSDDHDDFNRYSKMLERVGKPIMMSSGAEIPEIIKRRLFEWDERALTSDGRILLPKEAVDVCTQYSDWVLDHRQQLPNWFPLDNPKDEFIATYPFHPSLISVFQRKWQTLTQFQQTRGILRLLALWVSQNYSESYRSAHKDPIIGLGSAPLDDDMFRTAVFEQIGERRLEAAVTTDICGKKDSNSIRLDKEAVDTIKKSRLHRKVATAIFFESNGGATKSEATVPEIRLGVGEPDSDIGNIETVLDALTESCYYIAVERTRYKFSFKENLNKRFSDRRASIPQPKIEERVKEEIREVFNSKVSFERYFFPEKTNQISDRPVLSFIIMAPEHSLSDEQKTLKLLESITFDSGASARVFKSSLIFCLPETYSEMYEAVRKVLAWEDIDSEAEELHLDEIQRNQLALNLKKAKRDLKESIWRSYKNIYLLGKDNKLKRIDLGMINSSAGETIIKYIINRLKQDGEIEEGISPNFLLRNWPPAFKEWSIKSVRDAFFASPLFPRLLNPDSIKETIARGVSNSLLAYIGKTKSGTYKPFHFEESISASDVEISDEMFIITAEEANKHKEPPKLTTLSITPSYTQIEPGKKVAFGIKGYDQHGREIKTGKISWSASGGKVDDKGVYTANGSEGRFIITAESESVTTSAEIIISKTPTDGERPIADKTKSFNWSGEIAPQKWMNFYTKILSKYANNKGLRINVSVDISPEDGLTKENIEELKSALKELGLDDRLLL